jgi:uncharacterized membrane protein (UPF0127 family)
MRSIVTLLVVLLLAGACGGDSGPRAIIETGGAEVAVAVEIADSPAEQRVGLMHRAALDDDAGMLFLFPAGQQGGFWMKDTLIPLSIAFAGRDGRISRILDMEPCRADPCPIYDPGVAYTSALEVNRGAFRRWGVREGDRLRLER